MIDVKSCAEICGLDFEWSEIKGVLLGRSSLTCEYTSQKLMLIGSIELRTQEIVNSVGW